MKRSGFGLAVCLLFILAFVVYLVVTPVPVRLGGIELAPGVFAYPMRQQETLADPDGVWMHYVVNNNTKKFHYPDCKSVEAISPQNREEYNGIRELLLDLGFSPCGVCHP